MEGHGPEAIQGVIDQLKAKGFSVSFYRYAIEHRAGTYYQVHDDERSAIREAGELQAILDEKDPLFSPE